MGIEVSRTGKSSKKVMEEITADPEEYRLLHFLLKMDPSMAEGWIGNALEECRTNMVLKSMTSRLRDGQKCVMVYTYRKILHRKRRDSVGDAEAADSEFVTYGEMYGALHDEYPKLFSHSL